MDQVRLCLGRQGDDRTSFNLSIANESLLPFAVFLLHTSATIEFQPFASRLLRHGISTAPFSHVLLRLRVKQHRPSARQSQIQPLPSFLHHHRKKNISHLFAFFVVSENKETCNLHYHPTMAPTQQQAKVRKAQQLAIAHAGKSHKKRRTGPSTKARVQRYLQSTEPQLYERQAKGLLLLKGIRCSNGITNVMRELRAMAAPNSKLLTKANQLVAFESDGQASLEFLTTKNDCALFAVGSHNKKRPHHLTIGRTFDRQILDLAELAVLRFQSMKDYSRTTSPSPPKKRIGSKPLLLFVGDVWQNDANHRNLQNLLIDFYRGDVVDQLVVSGLDHIMVFTAAISGKTAVTNEPKILIHQRTYFCKLKKDPKNTSGAPLPYLIPSGPDLDFQLRRTQWAEPDLAKASRKLPDVIRKQHYHLLSGGKKYGKKNQSTNLFGETLGRLHLEKQVVDGHAIGRKSKALRRAEKLAHQEEQDLIEDELQREQQQEGYDDE